jgi:hypothetical protein
MKINNIAKLCIIQVKLTLIKIKSSLFLLLLMTVLLSLFIIWWKKSDMAKPTVLIANEENSVIANLTISSVLNNKVAEIVNFQRTDYEKGKKLIDKGDALLMVYIKKGTIDTLYEGKKAELDIYTKNENNDFTKLVISYIKGFTDIINVSQNAGLAYMDVLYKKGMTESERIDKFNELQSSYVKLTLARSSIFSGEDKVFGLSAKDMEAGYKVIVAVIVLGISITILVNSDIMRKNMRQRLILSGISEREIYATVISLILITDIVFLLIFIKLAKVIGIGG